MFRAVHRVFEPEGAVCANGSQYKYFVNFSEASSNVVIFLEGGGACSNYDDCSNGRPFNTDCIKEPAGAECIRDNYPFIRNGIEGVDQSYLLADSGPIVPATLLNGQPSNQGGLFSAVSTIWGVDTMIQSLPTGGDRIVADCGEVNALVSESFPDDRLAVSIFERDYNFSVATYESAFPIFSEEGSTVDTGPGRTEIYRLTSEDLESLRARLDDLDNLSYYMPYYRNTNTSHCLTVTGLEDVGSSELEFLALFQTDPSAATWAGTEIETDSGIVTHKDFIEQLLDDSVPQQSYYEGTCEGKYQVCALDCEAYDAVMCEAAVQ